MSNYSVVAGWSSPIDFTLLSKGATPSGTTTGFSVVLVMRDLQGNTWDASGDCAFTNTTSWIVRWTPDTADLVPGVYRIRFKVTDASSGIAYFPSDEPDVLVVRSEV